MRKSRRQSLASDVLVTDQRDKSAAFQRFGLYRALKLADHLQVLAEGRPDGDDHASTFGKLVQQRTRHVGCSGRDDDGFEWCIFRQTQASVTDTNADVAVAKMTENTSCGFR